MRICPQAKDRGERQGRLVQLLTKVDVKDASSSVLATQARLIDIHWHQVPINPIPHTLIIFISQFRPLSRVLFQPVRSQVAICSLPGWRYQTSDLASHPARRGWLMMAFIVIHFGLGFVLDIVWCGHVSRLSGEVGLDSIRTTPICIRRPRSSRSDHSDGPTCSSQRDRRQSDRSALNYLLRRPGVGQNETGDFVKINLF